MQIHGNPTSFFPVPISAPRLNYSSSSFLCSSLASGASRFFSGTRTVKISNPKPNPSRSFFFRPPRASSSTAGKDYYSTLKVSRTATLQEIKTSYRNLARKYHPDMNKSPGAEDKFKEIGAAYEVLSDDEKRSLYDRFGEAGLQEDYGFSNSGSAGLDPFEVFDSFFGGSNGFFGGRAEPGGFDFNMGNERSESLDIRHDLYLSFKESIFGGEREIDISCFEACERCDGTGAKSSSCISICSICGGSGRMMKTQKTTFGMMSEVSTCGKCGGEGKIITENCQTCGGKGRLQSKRTINIVIPAGVSDGSTMRIAGDGNFDNRRGTMGDLYLVLHVDEKHGIQREGLNLYSKINVYYTDAILGTTVKVETVDGMRDLKIPSGIQPGESVKLKYMGVPDVNNPFVRGHHHFVVNVVIPKQIRDSERVLLEELASFKKFDHHFHNASERNRTPEPSSSTYKVKDQNTSSSKQGTQRGTSLWNSVKGFLGRRQSSEGFATVTMDNSALLQRSAIRGSSFVVSLFALFIITCICASVGKTSRAKSQHKDGSRPRRTIEGKQRL